MMRVGKKAAVRAVIAAALLGAVLAGCDQEGGVMGIGGAVTGGGDGAGPAPIDAEKEIAALGAPADAATTALYQGSFEAVGSEPFWRLDLMDDWVAFTRPGLQDVGGLPTRRDYRAQGARIVAGPLVITLKATPCQHESGDTLPYTAEVNYEGVLYDGCARHGSGAASANWSSRITEMLPAIDACLARIENKPGRVSIAYVIDGKNTVRLTDGQGGRYECVASGAVVEDFGAIADRNVLQSENDPIFSRAPTPPPAKACGQSTELKSPDGAVLGVLTDAVC